MAINIGRLDNERTPTMVARGYYVEAGNIVYESDISIYEETPSFPQDKARSARCSECFAKGVLSEINTDFLREGMDVPLVDEEQMIRRRVECRGKGAIERAIADEKCRISVVQYNREGDRISAYKPGYQTGN